MKFILFLKNNDYSYSKLSIIRTLLSALLLFTISACNNQVSTSPSGDSTKTESMSTDDAAIKKAVDDAYAWISFKKGSKPDYEKIHDYFMPTAILGFFPNDTLQVLSLEQFVTGYKNMIDQGQIQSFYEEEMYGKTDQYGRIAQRLSSYKTYINTMDSVSERGVNSFQLIKTPAGWKISSIIWDTEKKGMSIPDKYLPQKNNP